MSLERHDLRRADGRALFVYGSLNGSLPDSGDTIDAPKEIHQRYDLLTDTWVAISPTRNLRPHTSASVEATCPLCPGGPEVPFDYDAAVFENRFPSFVADPPSPGPDKRRAASAGRCEVMLYTSAHSGSLAGLSARQLARVVAIWRDRSEELWGDRRHEFCMIFENRGGAVGATISHPHGQIYAFDRLPPLIAFRRDALTGYRSDRDACLGCHLGDTETQASDRTVAANATFTITVPFAARWPFEVHVRARRHGLGRLTDLSPAEQVDLAAAIRTVGFRYDGLFGFELPYMMTILEMPAASPDWHLAVEFLPPHRSGTQTKIRASVETATGLFINDTLPEVSAAMLAAVSVPDRVEAPAVTVRRRRPTPNSA
jgi:UDPglucose--hexose-1-phosphate uridylyltransferase